jgi:putative transposase
LVELINTALNCKPAQATQWSVRTLAVQTGLSPATVHRFIRLFGLQPRRTKSFTLSNDPSFVAKVRDIVGLYLHPPDNALHFLERACPPNRKRSLERGPSLRSAPCLGQVAGL